MRSTGDSIASKDANNAPSSGGGVTIKGLYFDRLSFFNSSISCIFAPPCSAVEQT